MDINDKIQAMIRAAYAADTRGKNGKKRTKRLLAKLAGLEESHTQKYLNGKTGMELDGSKRLAEVLGVDVSSVLRGSRHLSGMLPDVPVYASRSYPMDTKPPTGSANPIGSGPNLTGDDQARWILLDRDFGDYRKGDMVLVSPSSPPKLGKAVAALVGEEVVVGKYQTAKNGDQLGMDSGETLESAEFVRIGPVTHYIRATEQD